MSSDQRDVVSRTVSSIKDNFIFQLIAVASLIYSFWKSLRDINVPIALTITVGIGLTWIVYSTLRTTYRRLSAVDLPNPDGDFAPFRGTKNWIPRTRERITEGLSGLILRTLNKHVLLVSPSGTGKSTMLERLIPAKMEEEGYKVEHFDTYDNITDSVLLALQTSLEEAEKAPFARVEQICRGQSAADGDLESLLANIKFKNNILLCFDQVERYFLAFDAANNEAYGNDRHEIITRIIKSLAKNPQIRTLFAVRSEFLFGSLSNMFGISMDGADVDANVEFYFLWGLNWDDDEDDCAELLKALNNRHGGRHLGERLFQIAQVRDRMRANTFMLNLAGYLLEKFRDRKEYYNRLMIDRLSADDVIDIYLDAAFEGYVAQTGSSDRTLFDTVMYALASENKTSGQACTARRLAGLAHYPEDEVMQVVKYLDGINVVSSKPIECGEQGSMKSNTVYRINHEKISDRILKSDKVELDSRAIDGIRYLAENRVRSGSLTVPTAFPSSLDLAALRAFDLSYLAVVVFVLFGIMRCTAPQFTYDMVNMTGLYSWINRVFRFAFHSYYLEPVMYVPHFIAHVAWVSYIDRVNRSFLRFACTGLLWLASYCMSTIGIIFGVAVAYCPELFPIPIVVVGMLYGIILMLVSRTKKLGGQMKDRTMTWGYRSFFNVVVVFALNWWVITPLFQIGNAATPEEISNVLYLIAFESVLMLWFWWHIRADQNVPKIWAANLALFDKGRIFGR